MDDRGFRQLMRARPFAVVWSATVALGAAVVAWAVTEPGWSDLSMVFVVLLACAVVFEVWPVVVMRYPEPATIDFSVAFSLATLYLLGPAPAVAVQTLSWAAGQLHMRRAPWRFAFNVGQSAVVMALSAGAMNALGGIPVGEGGAVGWSDARWLVGSWLVYFLSNQMIVSGLLAARDGNFWHELADNMNWYVVADLVTFSSSAAVLVLAAAGPWLPLALAVPMLLMGRTYDFTRDAEHASLHDELSGVANRRRLMQRLEETVERRSTFAFLLIDLDRFKSVNDQHGHLVGDSVIVEVARRVQGSVRDSDLVARLAGDEFAVLLAERTTPEEARAIAERVHRALLQPVSVGARGRPGGQPDAAAAVVASVGASVGVVSIARVEPLTVDEVLHRADQAMYAAKQSGGGVCTYPVGLSSGR